MKKSGKLNLKKEKMLRHEELTGFRGGSGGYATCNCALFWRGEPGSTSLNGVTGYSTCSQAASAMLGYYGTLGVEQVNCYAG